MKCLTAHALTALLLAGALAGAAEPPPAAEPKVDEHLRKAFANPVDDPKLPRVLLVGDSISIGYTVPVRKLLQGKANVHRPPENCQHTAHGLSRIEKWLGSGKWDVIHFNWGIWDTHTLDAKTGAMVWPEDKADPAQTRVRHTPEQYRENLTRLVGKLQATKARLVWASTTPIMCRSGERLKLIPDYNAVAAGVMKQNGVEVDDLYSLVLPEAAKWQSGDKVHFNAPGYQKLAEQVSRSILNALAARDRPEQKPEPAPAPGKDEPRPAPGATAVPAPSGAR